MSKKHWSDGWIGDQIRQQARKESVPDLPTSISEYYSVLVRAVEFGFKGLEKGWNLEQTLSEFKKVIGR